MATVSKGANGGRPKTSVIWDFFKYIVEKDCSECCVELMDKDANGKRKRCAVSISGRNTTNLKNHLKAKERTVCF